MNRLLKAQFLFTLILTCPILHAAQANQQAVAKINPIHHITQDHIFFIHSDHINIYPKTEDILDAFNKDLADVIFHELDIDDNNVLEIPPFKAESTFEKDHAHKKLVDTDYMNAFKVLDSKFLKKLINEESEEFLPICKKILTTNTIDVNAQSLVLVAGYGSKTCFLKLLIEAGAEVNIIPPTLHNTPLAYAIDNTYLEKIKLLVFAGADIHNRYNKDRIFYAKSNPIIKAIFDEFYNTRDVLRMNLPHRIVLKVGNIAGISKEISEYLIGKRVKVERKPRTTQN